MLVRILFVLAFVVAVAPAERPEGRVAKSAWKNGQRITGPQSTVHSHMSILILHHCQILMIGVMSMVSTIGQSARINTFQ